MSGTSLDGLDVALCEIQGSGKQTEVKLLAFETFSYDDKSKSRMRSISSVKETDLEEVCIMHSWLGNFYGDLINKALDKWQMKAAEIDCIASHGQTIYHAPFIQHKQQKMPDATLQIGDGDHIAKQTGILTISDFRQKHTAAGGEGAPMVSFVDSLLFSHPTEERILLNIGGIANFTRLPAGSASDQTTLTTDTGPGNTLIDQAVKRYFSIDFDKDSEFAKGGEVKEDLLSALKSHEYFQKPLPKTTGPEVFNLQWVSEILAARNLVMPEPKDLVATLTRLSAETISDAISKIPIQNKPSVVYASGGGIHNPLMMKWIQELLSERSVRNFEEIGFNPDAKEAVLFAVLANETLSGRGFSMNTKSKMNQRVNFGKISLPE